MCFSSQFHVLLIKHIVRIFRKIESRIGLRFTTGPLCFPGFCSGLKKPSVSSMIFSPDSATLLKISAISLCISSGAYLMSSAWISSGPALFPFFSDLAAYFISPSVKGCLILRGVYSLKFPSWLFGANILLKWSDMILICSSSELAISPLSFFYNKRFLFLAVIHFLRCLKTSSRVIFHIFYSFEPSF